MFRHFWNTAVTFLFKIKATSDRGLSRKFFDGQEEGDVAKDAPHKKFNNAKFYRNCGMIVLFGYRDAVLHRNPRRIPAELPALRKRQLHGFRLVGAQLRQQFPTLAHNMLRVVEHLVCVFGRHLSKRMNEKMINS